MTITGKGTIYKGEYGWSITDDQKQKDGTYAKFYINVRFSKDLEPIDRSFVSVKGYTSPYKNKEGKTMVSYYITEMEVIGALKQEEKTNDGPQEVNPFAEFGAEHEEDLLDLPF